MRAGRCHFCSACVFDTRAHLRARAARVDLQKIAQTRRRGRPSEPVEWCQVTHGAAVVKEICFRFSTLWMRAINK